MGQLRGLNLPRLVAAYGPAAMVMTADAGASTIELSTAPRSPGFVASIVAPAAGAGPACDIAALRAAFARSFIALGASGIIDGSTAADVVAAIGAFPVSAGPAARTQRHGIRGNQHRQRCGYPKQCVLHRAL